VLSERAHAELSIDVFSTYHHKYEFIDNMIINYIWDGFVGMGWVDRLSPVDVPLCFGVLAALLAVGARFRMLLWAINALFISKGSVDCIACVVDVPLFFGVLAA
jgi:hypothetical protein